MALRIAWLLSTWLNAFLALSLMASSARSRMPSADWDSVAECAVLSKSLDTEAEYLRSLPNTRMSGGKPL